MHKSQRQAVEKVVINLGMFEALTRGRPSYSSVGPSGWWIPSKDPPNREGNLLSTRGEGAYQSPSGSDSCAITGNDGGNGF